jgi:hypothetical protein
MGDLTCPDGGTCHHNCISYCWREENCSPLTGYTGPWKGKRPMIDSMDIVLEEGELLRAIWYSDGSGARISLGLESLDWESFRIVEVELGGGNVRLKLRHMSLVEKVARALPSEGEGG